MKVIGEPQAALQFVLQSSSLGYANGQCRCDSVPRPCHQWSVTARHSQFADHSRCPSPVPPHHHTLLVILVATSLATSSGHLTLRDGRSDTLTPLLVSSFQSGTKSKEGGGGRGGGVRQNMEQMFTLRQFWARSLLRQEHLSYGLVRTNPGRFHEIEKD
ncbi:hypothetical protein ElyMa_002205800 [Elysia marginata]|uniref:Uncharacterized protein n=1 Tax=Elysia marginata TaxID=1093978 RepID=A0AAV4FV32_9GAST|nr:hypothetical protein ElyMa_002205800 [Elysia marginata]